jgi:hypothetical protein
MGQKLLVQRFQKVSPSHEFQTKHQELVTSGVSSSFLAK